MGTRTVVETGRDRKALVADAGYKQLSLTSAFAGLLTAYGMFAVLAGVAIGIIQATNTDIDISSQWRDLGMAGGLVVAGLLFLAYLFGGYVAGRMARRSGAMHGVAVFVLGVLVVAGAAALIRALGGADVATDNLRDLGVPTTADEWGDIATIAGIASLAAMLVGALLGGVLGERWHAKLLNRALDPQLGAEAEARRDAESRAAEAEEYRTDAFRRVRATTPPRTRRVDREADTATMPVPTGTVPAGSIRSRNRDGERHKPVRWGGRMDRRDDQDGDGRDDTADTVVPANRPGGLFTGRRTER